LIANPQHRHLLVDLEALTVIPKTCLPAETQLSLESRAVWKEVTNLIEAKEYSKATKVKQGIEARQRKDAATRKERNEDWVPTYFVTEDLGGRAELTKEGREMLETVYAE
jgi:oxysterol-binding protein-related protein 9/10/11